MKKKGRIKGFFTDFKNFIAKGNVLNLAVGIIIGGAFNKIVSSLVNDLIMPLVTLAVGGTSVEDWKWVITPANEALGIAENAFRYGIFIQAIIDFLIIALVVFMIVRVATYFQKKYDEMEGEIKKFSTEDMKKKRKELKATGLKGKALTAALESYHNECEAAAKLEAEKQKAEEEANKPETGEDILKDIRDLLKAQNTVVNVEKTEKE